VHNNATQLEGQFISLSDPMCICCLDLQLVELALHFISVTDDKLKEHLKSDTT
jgi:hypothetical protein